MLYCGVIFHMDSGGGVGSGVGSGVFRMVEIGTGSIGT